MEDKLFSSSFSMAARRGEQPENTSENYQGLQVSFPSERDGIKPLRGELTLSPENKLQLRMEARENFHCHRGENWKYFWGILNLAEIIFLKVFFSKWFRWLTAFWIIRWLSRSLVTHRLVLSSSQHVAFLLLRIENRPCKLTLIVLNWDDPTVIIGNIRDKNVQKFISITRLTSKLINKIQSVNQYWCDICIRIASTGERNRLIIGFFFTSYRLPHQIFYVSGFRWSATLTDVRKSHGRYFDYLLILRGCFGRFQRCYEIKVSFDVDLFPGGKRNLWPLPSLFTNKNHLHN